MATIRTFEMGVTLMYLMKDPEILCNNEASKIEQRCCGQRKYVFGLLFFFMTNEQLDPVNQ
jgi:hypothetical protein